MSQINSKFLATNASFHSLEANASNPCRLCRKQLSISCTPDVEPMDGADDCLVSFTSPLLDSPFSSFLFSRTPGFECHNHCCSHLQPPVLLFWLTIGLSNATITLILGD